MENEDDNNKKLPTDPLSKVFGLDPINGTLKFNKNGKIIVPDNTDDYDYSRQNIIDLIEQGNQYLQHFGQVAISAQEPRHFEVLTNLLNSLIEANEKLLTLKKHDQDIKAKELASGEGDTHVNNNLFVGSTTELQKMLENMNEKKVAKK